MNHLFFNQTYFESRGLLYAITWRGEDGLCDPTVKGESCFYRVIALFRKGHSPN